jgi:pimeloyl-ACP methyl ester carboxylesterase
VLLVAAKVKRPVVMVGASGGGFDVFHHAGRYPHDVAGLVLLDVPAGQRVMSHADGPPEWDDPSNPEHVDYYAEEHQMALGRLPIGAIPVTVVTATDGQSAARPSEQRVWLRGSSLPRQVLLAGGHDIAFENPSGVLSEILAVCAAVPTS